MVGEPVKVKQPEEKPTPIPWTCPVCSAIWLVSGLADLRCGRCGHHEGSS